MADPLANLTPVRAGQTGRDHPATKHGAASSALIRPRAATHRRRFLRQNGLRLRELDAVARAHLNSYVRLMTKVELIDAYLDEHGLIREDGEPQPVMRLYVSLHNSARLSLSRLEARLDGRDGMPSLEALILEGSAIRERRELPGPDDA